MFKNIKIILVLSISFLTVSCFEKRDDNDIRDVNVVEISGLEEVYSVVRFESANIKPILKNSDATSDVSNFTYSWKSTDNNLVQDGEVIISTEKDLTVPIELIPGDYVIYFTVTDNNTGIEWQERFLLEVVNEFSEGWLLLSDVNGSSRLDMISLLNDKYVPKYDVLGLAKSKLELKGAPEFVYCYDYDRSFYGIYVSTTGNGTVKLEPNTFDWVPAYNISNEFVAKQPADLKVDNIVRVARTSSLTAFDNNIYYYNKLFSYSYSSPVNKIDEVLFKASPFIARGYHQFGASIIYDETNQRFIRTDTGKSALMPNGELFDYNTGMDLIYMEGNDYNGGSGAETFAVLKDPKDDKRYLAVFNSRRFNQTHFAEVTATDFDKATSYAVSPDFGYVFYAVDDKVYEYDFSLKTSKLMLDKKGEQITLIKFNDFVGRSYNSLQSQLIVASYNGTEGTMELFDVPPVNGQITLNTKYTGFGKIKSITYRER